MSTKTSGQEAEDQACDYLRDQGLRLLDRNIAFKQGEIDLIMQDGDFLVFIEVRYRSNKTFGSALESVTALKQKRLIQAAMNYLIRHPRWQHQPIRFDVVAIEGDNKIIQWVKNAFWANESD